MATLVTFLVKILAMAVLGAQAARKRILDPGTDAVRAGPAFECLNGKNPATLSKKDILKEFARGKCSPMLVIPGLLSTKLLVRIKDCHALRDDFPDLFSACGFNACEKKWDEFWKKVPASEYTSWIPDVFSPLSIFAVNQSSNFCFARFIKQQLDFTKPIEDALVSNSAFEVGLYGNSARTAKFLGCGDGSVVDLLPTYYQTKETKTFGFFFQRLAGMGHVAGLTYQTLPYDFGKSYRNSEVNKSFADNLLRLFETAVREGAARFMSPSRRRRSTSCAPFTSPITSATPRKSSVPLSGRLNGTLNESKALPMHPAFEPRLSKFPKCRSSPSVT